MRDSINFGPWPAGGGTTGRKRSGGGCGCGCRVENEAMKRRVLSSVTRARVISFLLRRGWLDGTFFCGHAVVILVLDGTVDSGLIFFAGNGMSGEYCIGLM